jgi:hypothetical protein
MGCKFAAVVVVALLAPAFLANAQDKPPPVPSENALKLSAIIATVEQRDAFHYVSEVEWNEDGYYDVIYFTTDKAKVEMKIDAVTGKTR